MKKYNPSVVSEPMVQSDRPHNHNHNKKKGVTEVTDCITITKKGSLIHLKGNIPYEKEKKRDSALGGNCWE